MSVSAKKPSVPEKWEKVLSKVDLMLEGTLVAATQRLHSLDKLADDEASRQRDDDIFRLREGFQGLEKRLLAAEVATAAADLALSGGEKMVREYLAQADELRQTLADWTRRAIG